MALTRKLLKSMGIEEDKVDQIIDAHTETVDALKAERDKLKEENLQIDDLKNEITDLKDDTKNKWKAKYDALKEEFDGFKETESQKAIKASKEKAYRELLKQAGVMEKRINSVLRVSDIDKIELDKDGKIKGADELEGAIKEEWADFIGIESVNGANTATPPKSVGGATKTKEEIRAISDPAQRQKAMLENAQLFGIK